jgi:mannose-6-phosphate isomerase
VSQTITGAVKHYAWGDTRFIPALLGIEPDGRPWAELWLGTHAGGPTVLDDGTPLIGETGRLPYLLKVLAAAQPLSLQAHPNAAQACAGYERGVFADPSPKPELLVALTEFDALCGIRPVARTVALLREVGLGELADRLERDGPARIIADLYRGREAVRPVIGACAASKLPEAQLVTELDGRYPGEPSVAVTLLLNRVHLTPGQALHLTAGNLHAYLGGAGIELMGASDNVVRGGLTTKHVDVDELLDVLDPTPLAEPVMADAAGRYPLPETGCELRRIEPGTTHHSAGHELAVGLDGSTLYVPEGDILRPSAETYVVTTPA